MRDHRNRNPDFVQQSMHDPLVTQQLECKGLDEMSTAWITYPVSRSYGLPVKMEGMLEEASTKRLIKLYNTYSPKEMVLT